jgi:hypothetical protein
MSSGNALSSFYISLLALEFLSAHKVQDVQIISVMLVCLLSIQGVGKTPQLSVSGLDRHS